MPTFSRNIMVIEDEQMLLKAITKKLKTLGHETISCSQAEQALDYLKEFEEQLDKLPTLIWLDFYLAGGMNGLEFLTKLKENETWKNIPVIVVSNTASQEKVSSLLALGAEKYFIKAEHRLDEIVEEIEEVIEATK